jgi:hypothetical protein
MVPRPEAGRLHCTLPSMISLQCAQKGLSCRSMSMYPPPWYIVESSSAISPGVRYLRGGAGPPDTRVNACPPGKCHPAV